MLGDEPADLIKLTQTAGGIISKDEASTAPGTRTLTATPNDPNNLFFVEWTVSGMALTDTQKYSNPVTINVPGEITVQATFDGGAVDANGVTWARAHVAKPHTFETSPLGANWVYQFGETGRAMVAWPSTGTISASNPGYKADGTTVTTWNSAAYTKNENWPTTADVNPCPTGWVVPNYTHLSSWTVSALTERVRQLTKGSVVLTLVLQARRNASGNLENYSGYKSSSATTGHYFTVEVNANSGILIQRDLSAPNLSAFHVRCVKLP